MGSGNRRSRSESRAENLTASVVGVALALAETSLLAAQIAKVVEARPTDVATCGDLDFFDTYGRHPVAKMSACRSGWATLPWVSSGATRRSALGSTDPRASQATRREAQPAPLSRGSRAIGGRVVTVEEGRRAKRVFIGFGSGKSRLTSAAQLYSNSESIPSVVWEYQNTAASGAKPGILTTLPIGVAVQGFTLLLLVVNGGLTTMGELSSSSTANAKRMADELADAVEETLSKVTNLR